MSMYGKNHYYVVISLQLIKINGKKWKKILKTTKKGQTTFKEVIKQYT